MNRVRLKEYQNSYAEQMARYGLQRGIDGSQAKHVTTSQYYRDLLNRTVYRRGFGTQMIRQLFNKEAVSFKGEIYSYEHQRKFKAEHSVAKVEPNPQQPTKFSLNINGMDSYNWFRHKQKEFLNALGINPKEKRGLKI